MFSDGTLEGAGRSRAGVRGGGAAFGMCNDGTIGTVGTPRGGGELGVTRGTAPAGAAGGAFAGASGGAARIDGASGGPEPRPTGGILENGGRFGAGAPRGGGGSAPIGRSVLLRVGRPSSDRVGITLRTGTGGPTTGGGSDGTGIAARPRFGARGGGTDESAPRSSVRVPLGTVIA
jgi:hypothetical protein